MLDGNGGVAVTYSDIQGSWTGTGNIDDDPLFVDPSNSDYHLTATSPCIDAGDPTSPLDPDGTIADMGTYYCPQVSCTNVISPTENSEWITKYPTLKWEENSLATGYKLSLGTDDPPTNILNEQDLGNVTSYEITGVLDLSTPYFWKVIPYDEQYTATNCPVWSFTTQADVINAGNAFDFGNARQNDYLEISYSESMNPDQFTVSFWAKVEGSQGSYRSAITSRGNSTDGYLIYASNNNQWEFWTGTGSSWSIINGPDIVLDTWTHIAATFDGSMMKLYINGNYTGTTATNNSYVKNTQYPCRIGAGETEHTTPNYYFDGVIDEFRFWNYARTEAEIQADMNVPLEGNETGLNSYWRFDSDNTTYAWDCIGENQSQLINNPQRVISDIGNSGFLPITLSSFSVQYIENTPTLFWTTQSETDNAGWNVYRAENEEALSNEDTYQLNLSLGLIPGAGSTSEPTDYSFEDVFPVYPGTTYFYWLESVDYSGETENYGPISLTIPENEWQNPNSPKIPKPYGLHQNYPNPFNPNTEISFMMKESCIADLSIYNLKGQKIKTLFKNRAIPRDELIISNWEGKDESGKEVASGIYFYKLMTTKGNHIRKMVLMK